jgi:molybdopterin converting factor small subunit
LGSQAGTDRVHCVVELFGVARLLTKTKTVPLELPEGTTLSCLVSVLAERWPILVGRVIGRDKTSLVSGCACNVNGREFVRDPGTQIRTGDNVLILPADAGG